VAVAVLGGLIGDVLADAIAVAQDITGGITARFRTMAFARSSVMTGHVVGPGDILRDL